MSLPTKAAADARAYLGQLERTAKQLDREASIQRDIQAGTQEAYRWGRISRRDVHFQPQARSADSAIYEGQDLMHRRTRSEKLNNAQIKKIVETLADLVVGCGIQTLCDPFDPLLDISALTSDDLDEHLRYALESDERHEEWFQEASLFDVSGKLSGPAMQRLSMSECVEVGDAFILRCKRQRPGNQVSLCYQLLEREQLDNTKDRAAGPGQHKIINGIELDEHNREIAFHIFDAHPFDDFWGAGLAGKSTRVPADRVIHLYLHARPSQNIGVSWLHAIGQNNFDRDKYFGSELQSAAKAALLLLVAKLKHFNASNASLGLADDETDIDYYGNQEFKLGSTTHAARIGHEDSIEVVDTQRPNPNCGPFIKILDRDTAGGTGLSYYSVTGDYESTNYSSVRAAILAEDNHIRPIQDWHARKMALPMRREYNAEAVARGIVTSVSPRQFLENPSLYQRFDAMGPGREMLDPDKETTAAAGRCRAGFSNLKIELARRGLHWIRVMRQKALENRLTELLGVVLDFSKGQGGQVDKTTSAGQAEAHEARFKAQEAKISASLAQLAAATAELKETAQAPAAPNLLSSSGGRVINLTLPERKVVRKTIVERDDRGLITSTRQVEEET